MKVFLSWSGVTSHKVACCLRDWIPCVVQAVKPYVSSEDIDKGARWSSDIAQELEEAAFGVLCITKENLEAPWLNFEAGALSKTVDKAFVSPFLFRIKRSEVQGPLLQFQSTVYDKDDTHKLLLSINSKLGVQESLEEAQLKRSFEVWWPQLKESLDKIEEPNEDSSEKPSARKEANLHSIILEELLELARSQQRLLRSPEDLLPQGYLRFALERALPNPPLFDSDEMEMLHSRIIDLERLIKDLTTEEPLHRSIQSQVSKVHNAIHSMIPPRSRSRRSRENSRKDEITTNLID